MARYLLRRFASGIVVLFVFASALFFAVEIASPGDFASQFYGMPLDEKAELRSVLGLDLSVGQRYLRWLGNLLRGDLGQSYGLQGPGAPVVGIMLQALPPTLLVFGLGMALAFLLGQWLGKSVAWRGPGLFSSSTAFVSIMLYTSFPPWLAFLFSYLVLNRAFGYLMVNRLWVNQPQSFTGQFWRFAPMPPAQIMIQMLLRLAVIIAALLAADGLARRFWRRGLPTPAFLALTAAAWAASLALTGWGEYALNIALQAAIPLIVFTLLTFGEVMLIMRTTMADTLHEEYIQTARAKGLPPRAIRNRHAARNALLPALSRLVTSIPYMLTGMVMIEDTLHWDGIGSTMFDAFSRQNIPVVVGALLMIGLVSLGVRLLLDVLTAALDPRIRFSAQGGRT